MKRFWLSRHHGRRLLVFCNGWGMDHHPFARLAAPEIDVLMYYDYRHLGEVGEGGGIPEGYREIYLIGWSIGVWAGQQLFGSDGSRFSRAIAINGTLAPIDDRFGIPGEIYEGTLAGYSDAGQQRFYRRMCREKGVLATFLALRPQRSVDDQKGELAELGRLIATRSCSAPIYTDAVISDNDLVMPTRSQERFWTDIRVHPLEGCHFPFSRWRSWEEILELVDHDG